MLSQKEPEHEEVRAKGSRTARPAQSPGLGDATGLSAAPLSSPPVIWLPENVGVRDIFTLEVSAVGIRLTGSNPNCIGSYSVSATSKLCNFTLISRRLQALVCSAIRMEVLTAPTSQGIAPRNQWARALRVRVSAQSGSWLPWLPGGFPS